MSLSNIWLLIPIQRALELPPSNSGTYSNNYWRGYFKIAVYWNEICISEMSSSSISCYSFILVCSNMQQLRTEDNLHSCHKPPGHCSIPSRLCWYRAPRNNSQEGFCTTRWTERNEAQLWRFLLCCLSSSLKPRFPLFPFLLLTLL